MLFKLKINGNFLDVEAEPQTPLLWVLRDDLDLTGTKIGFNYQPNQFKSLINSYPNYVFGIQI